MAGNEGIRAFGAGPGIAQLVFEVIPDGASYVDIFGILGVQKPFRLLGHSVAEPSVFLRTQEILDRAGGAEKKEGDQISYVHWFPALFKKCAARAWAPTAMSSSRELMPSRVKSKSNWG